MDSKVIHLGTVQPRPAFLTKWERLRNKPEVHWFMECFAEMLGVFLYVYFGVGSTAGFVVGNIIKQAGLSSVLQIGFAYAFGILFALAICASTSGGHFNPCVTIAFVIFKGFSPVKALRYIFFQILGAYVACLVVYHQWHVLLQVSELTLMKEGVYDVTQFTPNGVAGIFALYLIPGAQTLNRALLNEFVNCFVLGVIVWAALDPTNMFLPPSVAPIAIGVAYAGAIWGYAIPGVSLNAARDVGGRLFAMSVWGTEASGGKYAAIAALVNIPATLLAALFYEVFLTDSDRVIPQPQIEFMRTQLNHRRYPGQKHHEQEGSFDNSLQEKPNTVTYEQAEGTRV